MQSLAGNRIWARSANGVIRGRFTASSLLNLHTVNAPISATVSLINGGESMTHLFLKTSNRYDFPLHVPYHHPLTATRRSRIDSEVSLVSNQSSTTGGNFHVAARASNAPLSLTVVDAPLDSMLLLAASTSNSPARVALHKTFQGTFDLSSSAVFRPEVDWSPVNDPAEQDRRRRVRLDTIKGSRVRGGVEWEEGGEERGKVVVETSNSPLRLVL